MFPYFGLIKNESNEIVASYAVKPFRYKFQKKEFIFGQSVETYIFFMYLDFLAAIKGYSQQALPNNLTVFFPLNPLLPFLPIKIANIIYSSLDN